MKQEQFLEVLDRDEAERRWLEALSFRPPQRETVPLEEALGRVLSADVRAGVDVPSFDRSNMDGFAVRSEDTFGASEHEPVRLEINAESIPTGVEPKTEVQSGRATSIATGGMLPRGADAVVPVELTDVEEGAGLSVRGARVPGAAISFAGTDMGAGETVLFAGARLTSRETGVLAAVGAGEVEVYRRPRVAVISTGDEIIAPGEPMRPGMVYDSNGRILCDAVRELGAEPSFRGAFRDQLETLREATERALEDSDVVVLSGGTSKGEGDLSYRVVSGLRPGVVVHGVALKPGKPICLAAHEGKPIVILPGFPTSAIFTFHEFVAPVIRRLAGLPAQRRETRSARLAVRVNSEHGRLEYLLVGLVRRADGGLSAYPMGKGSGSVTSFSRADGFVRIERTTEIVEARTELEVTLLGAGIEPADLVIVGSHCTGLDLIARALRAEGFGVKVIAVGSQGGLDAAARGECDVAPTHLLDPRSGEYNRPFLAEGLELLPGYRRMQGVVTRPEETRETGDLLDDPSLRMVNRNRGSGTRVLIDELLGPRRPDGYASEPRSHHAVAAAVAQGRADWGVTIESVAREAGLRFRPLRQEHSAFAVGRDRGDSPALRSFVRLLEAGSPLRAELEAQGFAAPFGDADGAR
ncbi:MAG: molybdopterin biosynthesis protein [Proteobacteria bacterium]|nr:molybdopterin biosynthesis protein [Pseudomonadota bacterium]